MNRLHWTALVGLLLTLTPNVAVAQPSDTDVTYAEQTLKNAKLGTDGDALLDVLRTRSLTEKDRATLKEKIALLGDRSFAVREKTSTEMGPASTESASIGSASTGSASIGSASITAASDASGSAGRFAEQPSTSSATIAVRNTGRGYSSGASIDSAIELDAIQLQRARRPPPLGRQ